MPPLSKLIALQQQCSQDCTACGRHYGNPIRVTNFSNNPMETYNACPFCFTKLGEVIDKDDLEMTLENVDKLDPAPKPILKEITESKQDADCPQYLGYLKKRPKNAPIPDSCLTCEKMVECIL